MQKRDPIKARISRKKWNKKNPHYYVGWNRKNPDKVKNGKLKFRYGITLEEYKRMLTTQSNKCAICSETFDRDCNVDHSHKTGKIRELLCKKCNMALGYFRDNPLLCRLAANYLDKWKEIIE